MSLFVGVKFAAEFFFKGDPYFLFFPKDFLLPSIGPISLNCVKLTEFYYFVSPFTELVDDGDDELFSL